LRSGWGWGLGNLFHGETPCNGLDHRYYEKKVMQTS
jgi:hypothetical protein